jgi:glucose/arabinose dehydrogenase/mono/diheme cytochrome c family protein
LENRFVFFAMRTLLLFCFIFSTAAAFGQQGDRGDAGKMPPPPKEWTLPAPPLSPEQALESFKFGEEGFAIELVASEPMILNPVCIAFDGNGRPWVCEMRGYMPDLDGTGEDEPNGRITILEDTNGDGQVDKAKVFLDELVLPRSIQFVQGGIIWADQAKLYFTERNGDEAGKTTVIDEKWATSGNVEHKTNGLIWGLDNWLYNAKSSTRYRLIDGEWAKDKTESRGQWGIGQDDFGRLVSNSNSTLLSYEQLRPGYSVRNPNHSFRSFKRTGINNAVWPIRPTTGINRGYQNGMLTDKGHLTRATGACGPTIYRGDQFPAVFHGNAFIPEPCGLLVKRAVIVEDENGNFKAGAAYEGKEFLGSMDERNRFVNSYTAPDGSLYLVDMVHGIIQHKTYVTTYLRDQLDERGLDAENNNRGRIYRVRWTANELGKQPKMDGMSAFELTQFLEHPNGWWRDTAQRLIVQSADPECADALRKRVAGVHGPLAQIHALWSLEGLGIVTPKDIALSAMSDDPKVLANAARVAEVFAGTEHEAAAVGALGKIAAKRTRFVDPYLAASLGLFRDKGKKQAQQLLVEILKDSGDDQLIRDMAMSGLNGAELEVAAVAAEHQLKILDDLVTAVVNWGDAGAIRELLELAQAETLHIDQTNKLLRQIAKSAIGKRHPGSVRFLLGQLETIDEGFREQLVKGMAEGGKSKGFKKIALTDKPDSLDGDLAKLFDFSGKKPEDFIKTAEDKRLYEIGKLAYGAYCVACHQPHGKGMVPLAPPLVDSEWVTGSERRLIALTMEGIEGPITVNGTVYKVPDIQPAMPGLRVSPDFTDEKIAAVLTYVRNTWDNHAPVVKAESVKAWRENEEARGLFTESELKEIK